MGNHYVFLPKSKHENGSKNRKANASFITKTSVRGFPKKKKTLVAIEQFSFFFKNIVDLFSNPETLLFSFKSNKSATIFNTARYSAMDFQSFQVLV